MFEGPFWAFQVRLTSGFRFMTGFPAKTPRMRHFSLTLYLDSGILETLRGVAPGSVYSHPDQLVDAPYGGRLEQATGCWTLNESSRPRAS